VKLVLEQQAAYPSLYAAVSAVARQQRLGVESLRRWVSQALVDAGDRRVQLRTPPRGYRLRGRSPAAVFYATRPDLLPAKRWNPNDIYPAA
jgi:transposase-like protein